MRQNRIGTTARGRYGRVDAAFERTQDRAVAVAADDVDELRRIGHQPDPAIGLGHFAGITLIEADSCRDNRARGLDPCGDAHPVSGVLDLGRGRDQQGGVGVNVAVV
jgi:hypothetical protein